MDGITLGGRVGVVTCIRVMDEVILRKAYYKYKNIVIRKDFEKKTEDKHTRFSIHGVKGESYDAVLIYVKSRTGSTITYGRAS